MSPKLPFAIALAAVLLAACTRQAPEPEPVRSVRTLIVAEDSAANTQGFAAEVKARTESRLAFRVGGKIVQRPAELGLRVAAGQVLARIDPEDLERSGEAAQAAVVAAETQAAQLDAEYKRFRDLRDQGFISDWDLERRASALKAARAQLDQARAQARVQRNQAAYAVLSAPAAGVITGVDAEVGAVVGAGTPVVRLAFDGPRDVIFSVPEDRIAATRGLLGREGALKVRLWGDERLMPAKLRELAASADPTTRTYLAKAELGAVQAALGRTATVLVDGPRADGVFLLPLAALVRHGDGSAVWLVDAESMTVRLQPVTVAGGQGNEAVVAQGLKPGQRVVTAGVHMLNPGQKVRLWAEPVAAR